MIAASFPCGSDGYPAPNYLLADDLDRPRFRTAADPAMEAKGPVFLVIGAGFTGLSAALRLAELRQVTGLPSRIILLEGQRVAAGPSGRSAGHVCGLQAQDEAVRRCCGEALGSRLIAAAAESTRLVRTLIARLGIPCDLRDGYLVIGADGRQTLSERGSEFGIDPYPFALGMAYAAARLGVEILEGVRVTGLTAITGGYLATTTSGGVIPAAFVLASGGHRMAEDIALLAPLRSRTTELRVSTIITDPLPDDVLRSAMPAAAGRRLPFANDSVDVAYGSIDQSNRVVFGAQARAWGDPSPERIMQALGKLLPSLLPVYRAATGRDLAWRTLVKAEVLCFTRNLLPNVGDIPGHRAILYVQALGGHGIAIGTLLGKAAAEKLWGLHAGLPAGELFDAFGAVPHRWLPPRQPWRHLAAGLGLLLRKSRL